MLSTLQKARCHAGMSLWAPRTWIPWVPRGHLKRPQISLAPVGPAGREARSGVGKISKLLFFFFFPLWHLNSCHPLAIWQPRQETFRGLMTSKEVVASDAAQKRLIALSWQTHKHCSARQTMSTGCAAIHGVEEGCRLCTSMCVCIQIRGRRERAQKRYYHGISLAIPNQHRAPGRQDATVILESSAAHEGLNHPCQGRTCWDNGMATRRHM